MTPGEMGVIAAARAWVGGGQPGDSMRLVRAVELLDSERAAAKDMRPWSLVVAEDEIYSTKTSKWYRVTKTGPGLGAGNVKVTCEGTAKPFNVPAEAMVKVRRSEMGQAVDVWAGIEVTSS